MNPLNWKPSPTISAIMLGALIGLVIGFLHQNRTGEGITFWFDRHPGDVITWVILGAFITLCAIQASRLFSK